MWIQKTDFAFFTFCLGLGQGLWKPGWPMADSSVGKINIIFTYTSVPLNSSIAFSCEAKSFSCHAVTVRKGACI